MKRQILFNKLAKLAIDAVLAGISLYLAFQIRFEGDLPPTEYTRLWTLVLPVIGGRLFSVALFGLWNHKWRYVTAEDTLRIGLAHVPVSFLLFACRMGLSPQSPFRIPLGVIAIDYMLSLTSTLGVRLLWRVLCERRAPAGRGLGTRRLLIIGAGFHGATVAGELARRRGVKVVGFLDDDPRKLGATIGGIRVLGPVGALGECLDKHRIDDVLVCIPPGEHGHAELSQSIDGRGVRVKFMPSVDEVLQSDWAPMRSSQTNPHPRARAVNHSMGSPRSQGETSICDQKILITGGAGFIGSSLALRLAPKNQVVLFDLSFRDKPVQFTTLGQHPNVRCVDGDILDGAALAEVCRDVDVAVHTAAVLGVDRVCSAARNTLETNYVGTSRLLQALEGNKRLRRFVHFSTSEVFGVNSYRVSEDTPPSVGPAAEARWSYAIAKLASEHLVKSYHRDAGMPVVIVRPFNVFGPRRTGDYALLRFMINAIAERPLEVHGDGSQIRAWCYIEDFCDAVMAMIERAEAVGEDFNIGNPGNTVTVYELARRVVELSESNSPIVFVEHPHPDISIRVPCLTKAQKLLAYSPQFDLDTGLRLTIEWYREHWDHFSGLLPAYAGFERRAAAYAGR